MTTPDLFDQKVKPLHFDAPKDAVCVRPEASGYFLWHNQQRIKYSPSLKEVIDWAKALQFSCGQDILIYDACGNIKQLIEREKVS